MSVAFDAQGETVPRRGATIRAGVGAAVVDERIAVSQQGSRPVEIGALQRRVAPDHVEVAGADRFDLADRGAETFEEGAGPEIGERVAALEVMQVLAAGHLGGDGCGEPRPP